MLRLYINVCVGNFRVVNVIIRKIGSINGRNSNNYGGGDNGKVVINHMNDTPPYRGSIPAKVGFWVGLRMFSYVRNPTKLTNAISKTQLLGPKKGGSRQKYPECGPFCIWRVLAVFSGLKPVE